MDQPMTAINSLLKKVKDAQLIEQLVVPGDDVIGLLCKRDEDDFCARWTRAFNAVAAAKSKRPLSSKIEKAILDLRECTFRRTFARWKSSDLAAYISDDFGLIGDSLGVGGNYQWINRLLQVYLSGEIPTGDNTDLG